MAPKRKLLTDPPAISSSSSSSSEEEDGFSSEENTPQTRTPKSPPSQKPESSSEEETDSEKHSVAGKPNPASPPPPKSSKRAKVADDSSKKPKNANRGMFERLWSEDDGIALLKGVIQFEEERGVKVTKDVPGFFDFIKDSLQCKVKLPQVTGKMKKLKRKFLNNKLKRGVEPKFANSYDQDCFDLSKRIWGCDGASTSAGGLGESSGVKSRAKSNRVESRAKSNRVESRAAKKNSSITDVGGDNKLGNGQNGKQGNGQVEVERPLRVAGNVQEAATDQADSLRRHFLRSCMGAANMEEMVKSGLEMLQGEKKAELEDRWMKFHVDRLELYLKHLDLLKEQSLLILAELKSSLVGKL